MNADYPIDISEVLRHIEAADVISIHFPLLGKTLLVDTRHDHEEGPLVKLVPVVESVEERLASLKQLRPGFPRPDNMIIISWPEAIRSLQRNGVWEHLVDRVDATGYTDRLPQCREAFQTLLRLERDERIAAITGDRYQTIWSRNKD